MSYKTINGLMKHLRDTGIFIGGSKEKRELTNTGYFHGYKGYRFYGKANNKIPFSSYDEVYATIQYDSKLKSLIYPKMMYIETALKNIALKCILDKVKSEKVDDMLSIAVTSYQNLPLNASVESKRISQSNKLNLQSKISTIFHSEYMKSNPQISHFYELGITPPIWALFENIMLGDFGFLLKCLTEDVRDDIAKHLGLSRTYDHDRKLLAQYVLILKNLRNAVAHNSVVFDARFNNAPTKTGKGKQNKQNNVSNEMMRCLMTELNLPYIRFNNIGDYIILMCFILKCLGVNKTELKSFIREYEHIIDEYKSAVSMNVINSVIQADLKSRINLLKSAI